MPTKSRCFWVNDDPLYIAYHDKEWGRPVHDDKHLFEMLTLEGAQAGLSWITVLRKRENYQEAFQGFDPLVVSKLGKRDVEALMQNEGIIRNRLKIESTISNARAVLDAQKELGSFDALVWSFVGGKTIRRHPRSRADVPATSPESDAMSKALKKRGFRFVGSTICYSFLQACGLIDDHVSECFRASKR